MNDRDNTLRTYRRQRPAWIPVRVHIEPAAWQAYDRAELEDICRAHPLLFPGYDAPGTDSRTPRMPECLKPGKRFTDAWGCVWEREADGMEPAVIHHPMAHWEKLTDIKAPDPGQTDGACPVDWEAWQSWASSRWHAEELVWLPMPRGHTVRRLQWLRGYEDFAFDMMDGHPRLPELIAVVDGFNRQFLARLLDLTPDVVELTDDLATEQAPLVGASFFGRYIRPSYDRLIAPIRESGAIVYHRSAGYVLDLADDLIDAGVDVLCLEQRVNPVVEIRDEIARRVAVELEIDRHELTQTGSRRDIEFAVAEAHGKLADEEGGFSMVYHAAPPTPIANIRVVCEILQKYSAFYP